MNWSLNQMIIKIKQESIIDRVDDEDFENIIDHSHSSTNKWKSIKNILPNIKKEK